MEILFDEAAIRARIGELGREIGNFYGADAVTLVVLANGALCFGADLARAVTNPVEWDVVSVASYTKFFSKSVHQSIFVFVHSAYQIVGNTNINHFIARRRKNINVCHTIITFRPISRTKTLRDDGGGIYGMTIKTEIKTNNNYFTE